MVIPNQIQFRKVWQAIKSFLFDIFALFFIILVFRKITYFQLIWEESFSFFFIQILKWKESWAFWYLLLLISLCLFKWFQQILFQKVSYLKGYKNEKKNVWENKKSCKNEGCRVQLLFIITFQYHTDLLRIMSDFRMK